MDVADRIGCTLTAAGAFFRVWAPHAAAVSVAVQDGEAWVGGPDLTHALKRAADDYWSATVPGVAPGQLYRFRIITDDGVVLERLDAAARDVISSELTRTGDARNASVVPDSGPYPWAPFDPPRFEDFLIYQFHVGTFAGRGDQHDTDWATFAEVESKLGYVRRWASPACSPCPCRSTRWTAHGATTRPRSSPPSRRTDLLRSCGTSSTRRTGTAWP